MKNLILALSIFAAQSSFSLTLNCVNTDGSVKLVSTEPCKQCDQKAAAFSFIGGEGILSSGIPSYESDMPGYISYNARQSKTSKQDVIDLIDGGVWNISMSFPKGYFKASHAVGETVDVVMDSSYSDIMDSELPDVALTCTAQE